MAEMKPDDYLKLIDQYFDQSLDEHAAADLQQYLKEDAGARAVFVRMSTIHRSWREWAKFETELKHSQVSLPDSEESRRLDEEVWQSILDDSIAAKKRAEVEALAQEKLAQDQQQQIRLVQTRRPEQPKPRHILITIPRAAVWGGIAAALLLAVVIATQFNSGAAPTDSIVQDSPKDVPPTRIEPAPIIHVASVSESIDAVWSQKHQLPGSGQRMLPGQYALERGAVGVDLQRGASVIIQAPCVFELVNDNRIKLHSGRVFAQVPMQATGFTVMAGGLQVIDLGTEFGVDVDTSGRVLTSVMMGAVALRSDDEQEAAVTLKGGESMDIPLGTALSDAQKMTDPGPLATFARSVKDAADPFLNYRQAVLADKPVLYWDFESVTKDKVIQNIVEPGKYDGVLRGPVRLAAGQIGKAGVFNGDNTVQCDVVSSDSLFSGEGHTAYTVQAWVRMDRVQKSSIAAFFQRDDSELAEHKHGMHLDLNGQGQTGPASTMLRFVHRAPVAEKSHNDTRLQGDIVMQQGRWVLLTAVKDREEVRIYADGVLVMSAKDTQGVDGPVQLSIGSPGVGLQVNRDNFRTFAGQIDEVAVYDYALSLEQINNHHRLGQPQP